MLNNKKKTIKTVLLGQSGVGKTSIVQRYINKTFIKCDSKHTWCITI